MALVSHWDIQDCASGNNTDAQELWWVNYLDTCVNPLHMSHYPVLSQYTLVLGLLQVNWMRGRKRIKPGYSHPEQLLFPYLKQVLQRNFIRSLKLILHYIWSKYVGAKGNCHAQAGHTVMGQQMVALPSTQRKVQLGAKVIAADHSSGQQFPLLMVGIEGLERSHEWTMHTHTKTWCTVPQKPLCSMRNSDTHTLRKVSQTGHTGCEQPLTSQEFSLRTQPTPTADQQIESDPWQGYRTDHHHPELARQFSQHTGDPAKQPSRHRMWWSYQKTPIGTHTKSNSFPFQSYGNLQDKILGVNSVLFHI